MASRSTMSSFMTGVNYLTRQQYSGDSRVGMHMINRRLHHTRNLYSKDLYAHYGCVNAIEFSNDGEWLVSGGDDKRVLIWNVDKTLTGAYYPKAMKGEHNSNIFCLGFNTSHTKLYSAGNDEQVILHDVITGETLDVFLHDEAVYGLSVDPVNENVFASACDDGRVLIWDIREASNDAFVLAGCSYSFHAVMYNPTEPRLIATANAKEGVALWDVRKPRLCLLRYGGSLLNQGAMSIRFNSAGTHLLALRRRLPPVLYEISSVHAAAEFDHQEYYNSCTMKSCCFAGENDQYVLSGSDDFKLYIWKVPDCSNPKKGAFINEAHLVLRGHRSIVNQVRYNNTYGILASSGVEKVVKLWNTFPMSQSEGCNDYVSNRDSLRKVYSHEEYINLVLESGQFMTHDYSHHSVQEDPRMMAFFDSLVQRDIEGWTSDSSETSVATDALNTCFEVQSAESSSTSSLSSSSDDETQQDVPKRSCPQTEFMLSDGHLTPQVLMCLSSLSQRALSSSQSNSEKTHGTDENGDSSLDRISQLIAQKRREQMLKINKKKCKLMKKRIVKVNGCSTSTNGTVNHDAISNKTLSIASQGKDKRKLLRKKRAKLNKKFSFSEHSSDSDIVNEELNQINVNSSNNYNETIHEIEVQSNQVPGENVTIPVSNGVNHTFDTNFGADCSNEISMPNSSTNGLNEAETTSAAENSNPVVFFQSKSGKHKRNYRKRSAEDMQDDC